MEKLQTTIFLMRHGATDKAFSSDAAVDGERILTEEGVAQEKRVGEYLKDFAPTAIYSSPVKRTIESATLIKEMAEIPGEIIESRPLLEMYHGRSEYEERREAVHQFFRSIISKHAGEHIVLVSHQDPIETIVEHLGFTAEELAFPCQMRQGYRLVFAGDIPVECQKINPAHV